MNYFHFPVINETKGLSTTKYPDALQMMDVQNYSDNKQDPPKYTSSIPTSTLPLPEPINETDEKPEGKTEYDEASLLGVKKYPHLPDSIDETDEEHEASLHDIKKIAPPLPNSNDVIDEVPESKTEYDDEASVQDGKKKKSARNRPRARGGAQPRVYPDINADLNDE